MSAPDPRIRRIEPSDVSAVVGLVHELADYERAAADCGLTAPQLHAALFACANVVLALRLPSTPRTAELSI